MANTKKKPAKAKEPNVISVRKITINVTQYDNGTENVNVAVSGKFKTIEFIGVLEEVKTKAIINHTI